MITFKVCFPYLKVFKSYFILKIQFLLLARGRGGGGVDFGRGGVGGGGVTSGGGGMTSGGGGNGPSPPPKQKPWITKKLVRQVRFLWTQIYRVYSVVVMLTPENYDGE